MSRDFPRSGPIRVVNYHCTPASRAGQYEREFAALAARYAPVGEDDLDRFFSTGRWPQDRPGVIPTFYNGYRDNFDVARPLLDRQGLKGWFFAVTGFTDCPPGQQRDFARAHSLSLSGEDHQDDRCALSWEEMGLLEESGHVVASHTRTHSRVSLEDAERLSSEIEGAQEDFRRGLGHPVGGFAWLLGGRYGENPMADTAVDRAGYRFLFSNLMLQRLK